MIRSRLVSHIGGYGGGDLIATDIGTRLIAPGLGDDAGPLGSLALALDAMQHAIAVDAQLHI